MLRFIDSCGDHYSSAQLTRKWDSVTGPPTVSTGGGRRGSNALSIPSNGSLTKILDNQPTWTVGFNFKYSTAPNADFTIITLMDGATEQVSFRLQATTANWLISRNGTTLGTVTAPLAAGVEGYIEFKSTINNTTGTWEIRLNGASLLSGTAANTRNTTNNYADRIRICNSLSLPTCTIDDLYICDGTGTANNSFLGDVRVDVVLPTAAGANTGMTPNSAVANYTCVDEATANDDTDYVSSSVSGTKDTYTFADITHTPVAIFGVQVNMTARKDDAGARSICSVVRSGGADTDGTSQALSTSYALYRQIIEQDPNTSAAWTKTGFNAAEFGEKVAV